MLVIDLEEPICASASEAGSLSSRIVMAATFSVVLLMIQVISAVAVVVLGKKGAS